MGLVMKEAKSQFSLLPAASQLRYRQKANLIRKLAKGRMTPLARAATTRPAEELGHGPLGIASLRGEFPVVPAAIGRHQQTCKFVACVRRCKDRQPAFYTDPLPGFPHTVTEEFVCRGPTTEGCRSPLRCTREGKVVFKEDVATILDFIRLAINLGKAAFTAVKSIGEDPSVVLRVGFADSDAHHPQYYLIPNCKAMSNKTTYSAEFLHMCTVSNEGAASSSAAGVGKGASSSASGVGTGASSPHQAMIRILFCNSSRGL